MTSPPRTTASGLLIGGEWVEGGEPLAVLDRYSGETVAELRAARPDDVDRAVAAAASTAGGPPLPAWRRAEILEGRLAFTLRVPVGVGCVIAPLNTVAHPRIVVLNLTAPGPGG